VLQGASPPSLAHTSTNQLATYLLAPAGYAARLQSSDPDGLRDWLCCSKIAEAEAAVSVNKKKWLVMHMHVQLKLDELRGPPNPWLTVTLKVPHAFFGPGVGHLLI
jgi:hypothetical protein